MKRIYQHFLNGFKEALAASPGKGRRIGAELKFPLVKRDGAAASFETVCALWAYLRERGWMVVQDAMTGKIVGARKPGEQNDTVASCETGYCKTEFSLAHVSNLFDLEKAICGLRDELRPFADEHEVHFLGYGIQPVTPPSERLLMPKGRSSVWDKVFASNRHIPKKDGDDVHLFTINAATHVHISVSPGEAIRTVNVLNGFAGAQIALTAHSNIWRGRLDPQYKCVAEKFWDWWMPDTERVGIPERPFKSLQDYVHTITQLRPVYVNRTGKPIILQKYRTFEEYFNASRAVGIDSHGREVSFVPKDADIDLHNTCYWYDARLSRYYTVENRANDQQPPEDIICIAALTLGLLSALDEAAEEISRHNWDGLRAAREEACRSGLSRADARAGLTDLASRMLDLANFGLRRRELGEERFLAALERRLSTRRCPADETARLFDRGGIDALLEARKF